MKKNCGFLKKNNFVKFAMIILLGADFMLSVDIFTYEYLYSWFLIYFYK